MRLRTWGASDAARFVIGIQWAIVFTVVESTSRARADSGLVHDVPLVTLASGTPEALLVLPVIRTYSTVSEVVVPFDTRSSTVSSRSPTRSVITGYMALRTAAPAEVAEPPVTRVFRSAVNWPDWIPL